MLKFLATTLVTAILLCGQAVCGQAIYSTAIAGTCASNCGSKPIQFTPGQNVTVELVNRTSSIVLLQTVPETDPIPLRPGQMMEFTGWGGTKPNVSMVFWDPTSLPLLARIAKPAVTRLRVEIVPGGRPPGDRSIYIRNDGRVQVF